MGTLLLGRIIDRYGFAATMAACFLLSVLTIALIGQPSIGPVLLFAVIAMSGFCIIGGQPALNAFATNYYPTSLRATGVGWSLGIGRFGSVLGPLIGAMLISQKWSNSSLFIAAAVPSRDAYSQVGTRCTWKRLKGRSLKTQKFTFQSKKKRRKGKQEK